MEVAKKVRPDWWERFGMRAHLTSQQWDYLSPAEGVVVVKFQKAKVVSFAENVVWYLMTIRSYSSFALSHTGDLPPKIDRSKALIKLLTVSDGLVAVGFSRTANTTGPGSFLSFFSIWSAAFPHVRIVSAPVLGRQGGMELKNRVGKTLREKGLWRWRNASSVISSAPFSFFPQTTTNKQGFDRERNRDPPSSHQPDIRFSLSSLCRLRPFHFLSFLAFFQR